MNSIKLVCVFAFAVVAFAADENAKVCIKATDDCAEIRDSARSLFRNLRALDIVEPTTDIPKYINQLHELFNVTLNSECVVNVCKCTAGALECGSSREDIKNILQNKVKLPECLGESEKATQLLESFKNAIADGNREALLAILDDLHKALTAAIAKGDNEKMVQCITKTIQHIRDAVKTRVQQSDFQPNCDFCKP